jgi:hypothetical protein
MMTDASPGGESGAPDRIRTCDLRLRRPTLYPLSYRRAAPIIAFPLGWLLFARGRVVIGPVLGPDFAPAGMPGALPPVEHPLKSRRNAMYMGGGIIGLILLILLLTGNL